MARELTRGSPVRLIFLFALPLLLGNAFQQFYSMADTLIVGRTLGVDALAGVGSTWSILFLFLGFLMGMASGFSITCAQRYGARDKPGLRRSFCAALLLGAGMACALTTGGVAAARPLLAFINTPPEIFGHAHAYLRVTMWGAGATMLYNVLSATIMALGDSRTPLFFLVLACLLNIALDLVFILRCGMGVEGAALATVISQGFSGLCCLLFIVRRLPVLRPRARDWRSLDPALFLRHIRMGLPMGFQASVIALGAVIIQTALNRLGAEPVAAFTAAMRIDSIGIMPLMSFGLAMATYTGQNFGAGRMDRIRQGVRQASALSLAYAAAAAALCIFAGAPLVRIFVGAGQERVVELGREFLFVQAVMYWALALLFIIRNTLQGLGKSMTPTIAGVMELVMRAFAALALAPSLGFLGVCLASPLAWVGSLIPLSVAYALWTRRQGRTDGAPPAAAGTETPRRN